MNKTYGANIKVIGIARNPDQNFIEAFSDIQFISADISKASFDFEAKPECIFNAAPPSSPSHGGGEPKQVMDAATTGTQNLINIAAGASKPIFINLSSGIVTKRCDDHNLDTDNIKDSYLEGKRRSEELLKIASFNEIVIGRNLRLYAFAGPGISLVDHFAVGNFVHDALQNSPIKINGNPETRRSYLYPTDLMVNIFAATTNPPAEDFEIGSFFDYSMHDLAILINQVTGNAGISQASKYGDPDVYFPKTGALIADQRVSLESAISRWVSWLKKD